jgi:SPP1 family predicted phage head-tail adaptor
MAYNSGFLKDRVTILNRKGAVQGKFGLDSAGIEFEPAATVWANVDWQRGKSGMTAGALDAYGVKIVRMRWNNIITERSRIQWHGRTYQILPETFNAEHQGNAIQFLCQQIVNDKA